jgi:tetratricopeptide (TPR) repeat protein
MHELSDELHSRIADLTKSGDGLVDAGSYADALLSYHAAWELLPTPKEVWEAATFILVAIGDAHFFSGSHQQSLNAYGSALLCPDGLGNPYIHLRRGEAFYELGEIAIAQDELARAYMGAGAEIFEAEEDKYFDCLKSVLEPPFGRESL